MRVTRAHALECLWHHSSRKGASREFCAIRWTDCGVSVRPHSYSNKERNDLWLHIVTWVGLITLSALCQAQSTHNSVPFT